MDMNSSEAIRIAHGIDDPVAGRWVELRSGESAVWMRVCDFAGPDKAPYKRLASLGFPTISDAQQKALRESIAGFTDFAPGIVADRPGWHGACYVLPSGEIISPPNCAEKPVVAFRSNPK